MVLGPGSVEKLTWLGCCGEAVVGLGVVRWQVRGCRSRRAPLLPAELVVVYAETQVQVATDEVTPSTSASPSAGRLGRSMTTADAVMIAIHLDTELPFGRGGVQLLEHHLDHSLRHHTRDQRCLGAAKQSYQVICLPVL